MCISRLPLVSCAGPGLWGGDTEAGSDPVSSLPELGFPATVNAALLDLPRESPLPVTPGAGSTALAWRCSPASRCAGGSLRPAGASCAPEAGQLARRLRSDSPPGPAQAPFGPIGTFSHDSPKLPLKPIRRRFPKRRPGADAGRRTK